jgi:hypothetical protein
MVLSRPVMGLLYLCFPTDPLTENVWKQLLQGIIEVLNEEFRLQLALRHSI